MRRNRLLLFCFVTMSLVCCNEPSVPSESSQGKAEAQSQSGGKAYKAPQPKGHEVHLNLQKSTHLADVEGQGLFIDLGTPSQNKYTVGNWRSGWYRPQKGEDFAYVGIRGRLYFHADKSEDLTATVRLKPYGTKAMTPYLNNKQLKSLFFGDNKDFAEYTFTLPKSQVKRGENYLLLTFGGTRVVSGKKVSVAVDFVQISSKGEKTEDGLRPRYHGLVKKVTFDNGVADSLVLPTPSRISWYVEVPPQGKLTLGVAKTGTADVKASLLVEPEGKPSKTLKTWSPTTSVKTEQLDLSPWSGKVVRLSLSSHAERNEANAVAFIAPTIWSKENKPKKAKVAKNLIVVLTDTLRADKLPPYNSKTRVKAPTIAQVAKEGIVFLSSQSPENWTKPSVASILTSLHPVTHKTKKDASKLPDDARMLSEHLQGHGYKTAGFVANGYVSGKFGFEQGWNFFTNYIRENRSREAKDVYKEAGDWIEKNKDKRFFSYIQTIDPHVPYDPPQKYMKLYDGTNYGGPVKPRMTAKLLEQAKKKKITFSVHDKRRLEALHDGEITQHDFYMGKFIERMKKIGVWDKSVFVFVSDHGEEFNDHGSWGHGHSVFQELLYVPLIFRLPGAAHAGTRVPQTVSTMDLAPTALDMMDIKPMPDAEGRSLRGFIEGNVLEGPAVAFSDFLDDRRVIVGAGWKLILRGNLTATMFNLNQDPGEKKELDLTDAPVAERYLRILHGQFLGAKNKEEWLEPSERFEKKELKAQDADIDSTLREQLKQLGYGHDH